MNKYNSLSSNPPCFHGNCFVKMANNTVKKVNKLEKDDYVWTCFGPTKVICVLQTNIKTGGLDMVEFPTGLIITPYHPIKWGDTNIFKSWWMFPIDVNSTKKIRCEAVYSIALERYHIININTINCICIGHRYESGILKHDYFGQNIINDLSKMPGWSNGKIIIEQHQINRDTQTQLVNGIQPK